MLQRIPLFILSKTQYSIVSLKSRAPNMAHLQFSAYEGFGDRVLDTTHYSQAERVGNTVEISGQGTSSYFSSALNRD